MAKHSKLNTIINKFTRDQSGAFSDLVNVVDDLMTDVDALKTARNQDGKDS